MALINIDSALNRVKQQLRKIQPGQCIEILSYKRNRGVSITLLENGQVHVRERGYEELERVVEKQALSRLLKSVMKREFPRSRKVRIYRLESMDRIERKKKIL
ncbi:MAG TPA: hypothetical protein EYP57_08475 [Thermodesulfobacteriaceae bacterium]|nr:hypothetical protein [Thermodesulfobacteriaceae bacterium]